MELCPDIFMRHRRFLLIARLVVVFHALALFVSIAAPFIQPTSVQVVCSAGKVKVIVVDADGHLGDIERQLLDCPMCMPLVAPPPPDVLLTFEAPHPLAHALSPIAAARLATLTGAPLPARGPPASLA